VTIGPTPMTAMASLASVASMASKGTAASNAGQDQDGRQAGQQELCHGSISFFNIAEAGRPAVDKEIWQGRTANCHLLIESVSIAASCFLFP
jgi:hypothetical protein